MDKPNKNTNRSERPEKMPAAGPHAKPELTDSDKTPGGGDIAARGQGTGRGFVGGIVRLCRTAPQTTLNTSISTAPGNIERQAWM
jgi:hypothetical protein